MSDLSLIPFGLKQTENLLVDVSEVVRGKKCNCICPSCKTPLIARQGKIKEWHFAHATKGVSSKTKKECEYSFWVSVILMAKQILESGSNIKLPPHTMYSSDADEYLVSKEATVKLNDLSMDQKIDSILVDAALKLGEYTIALIFTAPHKNNIRFKDISKSRKIGILEISLEKATQWLHGNNNEGKYTQALKENILNNNNCKSWYFHPRQLVVEKKNNVKLYETCPVINISHDAGKYSIESRNYNRIEKNNIQSIVQKNYRCVICKNTWFGTHVCSNCKTHLYSTEVKNA